VKNYVSNVLSKLVLERRTQAAVLATRLLGDHPGSWFGAGREVPSASAASGSLGDAV